YANLLSYTTPRPTPSTVFPYTTIFRSPIVWKHKVGWKYKLEKVNHPEMWTVTAVRRILSNPVYLGHTINFRTKKKSYKSHSVVLDRKSTRLNSSHVSISYAVFCLTKKI